MKPVVIMLLAIAMATALAARPGEMAPDFRLSDLAGKPVTLASLKGKPAVITFWASWCPVCKAEFPKLHELARAYRVPIVVISREPRDSAQLVAEYMKTYPAFLPLVSGNETAAGVANRFKVLGQPWTFVLDAQGRVVNLYGGKVEVESLKDDLALAGYED